MKTPKHLRNPDYNEVRIYEAKGNPMFPLWMTERIRFLKYKFPIPCACCGKRSKWHWTMLMNVQASIFEKHVAVLQSEPKVHQALTPVCRDHPLDPIHPLTKTPHHEK